MEASRTYNISSLGVLEYQKAWDLQKELVQKRARAEIPDTLLFLEHPSIFTIGRRGSRENILVTDEILKQKNIAVCEVDRGGDITYHGPGQIIGYPILDLNKHKRDIHLLLRNLEEVILRFLSDQGVRGQRISGKTGVWVEKEKIAAIGVGVRRWISFHGFCLNINPDLDFFSLINPCGFKDGRITSLEKLKGNNLPATKGLQASLARHFGEVFNLKITKAI